MKATARQPRARYLDEAKGLGILCIVFLHYEQGVIPGELNTFIGSFMISIFYIVAGWIMSMKGTTTPLRDLARKRWQSLGMPYLYWTAIILIFDTILWVCGYYDSYFLAREIYKSIVLRGIGTLWFLPALFFGELICTYLLSRKRYVTIITIILILCFQWGYMTVFSGKDTNIWNIIKAPFYSVNSALSATIYVMAGYYLYKFVAKRHVLNKSGFTFLIGMLCCCIGFLSANYINCLTGDLSWAVWQFFAPILGPLGFILVFNASQNIRLMDYFDYWGRNSLSLMVTHYSIVQVLLTIIVVNVLHLQFWGWITIVAFIVSMPIQYFITNLINFRFPFLLGNK